MEQKKTETKTVVKKEQTNLDILKGYFSDESVKGNLQAMLGTKSQGFVTSVLSVVSSQSKFKTVVPATIYSSAMVAASLDLPINPSLGFAAIVPYGTAAQFQIMTRGLVQLAIRSGQYAKINNAVVHKGELVSYDPFKDEYNFDVTKRESDEVIGYMAYFKTVTGFEKYFYMTKEDAIKHGKRYSKSFNSGVWSTDPDAMCLKTVLKLLLAKYGILSIEMQRAIRFDQGVAKGDFTKFANFDEIDEADVEYIDNPNENPVDEKSKKVIAEKFNDFN